MAWMPEEWKDLLPIENQLEEANGLEYLLTRFCSIAKKDSVSEEIHKMLVENPSNVFSIEV